MLVVVWITLCAMSKAFGAETYLNAQLPWHPAVLDAKDRVLAWYQPDKNLGYDHFVRLDWFRRDTMAHRIAYESER